MGSWGIVAACRLSVEDWSAALLSGSDGTSTVPGSDPARATTHGRPRRDKQLRSKSRQLWCVQEESAGGSAISAVISGLSTERNKTGTPTAITLPNAIRAAAMTKRRCEYKAHLLKAAPAPRRFRARTTVLWRDYVRSGGWFPAESETVFNASPCSRPGWDRQVRGRWVRGLTLRPSESSERCRTRRRLPNTGKYARLVATAAYCR
jgi:hypothetical protein